MRDFSVTSIGHTGITVSDLSKSLRFYRDVLGFECSKSLRVSGPDTDRFVGVKGADLELLFVRAPGHMLELLQYTKPDDRKRSQLRPCDTGNLHLCFKVSDIDKALDAMRAEGFDIIGDVQMIAEGPCAGGRAIYTRDPDGVHIELIQDRPGTIFEETFFPEPAAG